MAKSKVRKKKVTKKPVPKSKTGQDRTSAIIVIAAILAMSLVGYFTLVSEPATPEFEEGTCYLDRSYLPVQSTFVYEYSKQIQLRPMKVYDLHDPIYSSEGWFLTSDYSAETRLRTFEFVRKHYTVIPCSTTVRKGD